MTSNPYGVRLGGKDENITKLIPFNRTALLVGLQYDFK